jgi:hypothetical protein
MKRLKQTSLLIITLFFVSFLSSCDMYSYVTPSRQFNYQNPQWAPPYIAGVRYFYLPDIETYYDLSSQEFIYLNDGQWSYSQSLPYMYAGFDLNNCFAIALDINTYQPWMHNQYYVSHYPRYYYRDYYDHSNIPYVRGYNENGKSAIFWSEKERGRARSWDAENLKKNRNFIYSKPDRQQQNNNNYNEATRRSTDNADRQQPTDANRRVTTPAASNNNNERRQQPTNNTVNGNTSRTSGAGVENRTPTNNTQPTRTSQRTNYYGRNIGQPVKVEKQMREQAPATTNKTNATPRNEKDQNENNRR